MDFVANWLVQGCVVALATVVIVRCLPRALRSDALPCVLGRLVSRSCAAAGVTDSSCAVAGARCHGRYDRVCGSGLAPSLPDICSADHRRVARVAGRIRRATRNRDGRDSTGAATLPFIPARPGAPPPQLDTSETPGPRRATRCLGRRAGSGGDWVWLSSHCGRAGTGSTPHGCRARSRRDSRVGTRAAAGRSREYRSAHGAAARRVASGRLVARSMAASRARGRLR